MNGAAAAQPAVNTHARTQAHSRLAGLSRLAGRARTHACTHARTHARRTHARAQRSFAEQCDARGQGHGRIFINYGLIVRHICMHMVTEIIRTAPRHGVLGSVGEVPCSSMCQAFRDGCRTWKCRQFLNFVFAVHYFKTFMADGKNLNETSSDVRLHSSSLRL